MINKIRQLNTITKLGISLTSLVLIILAGAFLMTNRNNDALAQSSTLTLQNIRVSSISSTLATITWDTNIPADSTVNYGTSGSYGLNASWSCGPIPPCRTNHNMSLAGLTAGTVYHYQVVSSDGSETVSSQDRTFTTPIGSSGDTDPPNIFNINGDISGVSATISFVTDEATNAFIEYDTNSSLATAITVAELAGSYNGSHTLFLSPLLVNTQYYYRITATDQAGNSYTTVIYPFTTPANPNDHTFTTGACIEGTVTVQLGQCAPSGRYCSGGSLVWDCTQCGYQCPANQTCRIGGACVQDPPVGGSAYECNDGTCYDPNSGAFKIPADAGCYASWPRCNANIVLKVQKDRICDRWLTCGTSTAVTNRDSGKRENLCVDLSACNELGENGGCKGFISKKQCSNDPLTLCNEDKDCPSGGSCINATYHCSESTGITCIDDSDCPGTQSCISGIANITYVTPDDIDRIKNLSGAVVAGLDWTQVPTAPVIHGYYPWSTMPQFGNKIDIPNSGFEERIRGYRCLDELDKTCDISNVANECSGSDSLNCKNVKAYDIGLWQEWSPTNLFLETGGRILNHWDDNNDPNSGNRVMIIVPTIEEFSGAAMRINSDVSSNYFLNLKIKSNISGTKAVVQFGPNDLPKPRECINAGALNGQQCIDDSDCGAGSCIKKAEIDLDSTWQYVTIGPVKGLDSAAFIKIVCFNDGAPCDPANQIIVDDINIRPTLEVQAGTINKRVPPSCRLYPRGNSEACAYVDDNGINYRGWYGYCLEEWPEGTGNCISWWPVDLIKGEHNLFGDDDSGGYAGRTPLYMCVEAGGAPKDVGIGCTGTCYVECEPNTSCNAYDPLNVCANSGQVVCVKASDRGFFTKTLNPTNVSRDYVYKYNIAYALINYAFCDSNGNCNQVFNNRTLNESNNFSEMRHGTSGNCTIAQLNEMELDDWNDPSTKARSCFAKGTPYPGCCDSINYVHGVQLRFDNNGRFVGINVGINHHSSGIGWTTVDSITIFMRDQCNTLVQVTQPGESATWTGRTADTSSWTVPDLNYDYLADLKPIGGTVNPSVGSIYNPSTWGASPVHVERNNALTVGVGQARAASPYACDENDCNKRRCLGGGNRNSARCQESDPDCVDTINSTVRGVCVGVGHCEFDNADCTSDAQCTGLCIGGAANNRGTQQVRAFNSFNGICNSDSTRVGMVCRLDTDCPPNFGFPQGVCTPDGPNVYFAQERLRQLFAQSYGVWHWDITQTPPQYVLSPGSDKSFKYFYYHGSTAERTAYMTEERWQPPQVECSGNCANTGAPCKINQFDCGAGDTCQITRSGVPGDWAADNCAVRPVITNFLLGPDNSKEITIPGGSGLAEFRVTVDVNAEQFPLRDMRIDFNDDDNITPDEKDLVRFPTAPKSSLSEPHIFEKEYTCTTSSPAYEDKVCEQRDMNALSNGGEYRPCNVDTDCVGLGVCQDVDACFFYPRIQAEDGWHWCDGGGWMNAKDAFANCTPEPTFFHAYASFTYNWWPKGRGAANDVVVVRVNRQ
ncbi:fibronectin type III domain-containing protein [Patescibacteria group bacterium]